MSEMCVNAYARSATSATDTAAMVVKRHNGRRQRHQNENNHVLAMRIPKGTGDSLTLTARRACPQQHGRSSPSMLFGKVRVDGQGSAAEVADLRVRACP